MNHSSLTQQTSPASVLFAVAFRGIYAFTAAWRHVTATDFDLRKAREAVWNAKRALTEAEHRFDTERAPGNACLLIAQVRSAERRVAEARSILRRIDPGNTD
jgi:hypothetical protein